MSDGLNDWRYAQMPDGCSCCTDIDQSVPDADDALATETLCFWLMGPDGTLIRSLNAAGHARHVTVPMSALARTLAVTGATAMFMTHNHPWGDPRPSRADVDATRRLWRLTRAMGVSLQDHVILGHRRVFSFRANGLL